MPDREKVISEFDDFVKSFSKRDDTYYKGLFASVLAMLKEQEAVVRCKDCKNVDYGTDEDGNRFMKCIGSVKCYGGTTPDFFCADGERKEGR